MQMTSQGHISSASAREEEFTIQNEDFPALPGATQPKPVGGNVIRRDTTTPNTTSTTSSSTGTSQTLSSTAPGEGDGSRQAADAAMGGITSKSTLGPSPPSPSITTQTPPPAPGSLSMGIGFGSGVMGHAPPSPSVHPTAPPSGGEEAVPVSQEARYGLLGLLDVVKMTDRVSP